MVTWGPWEYSGGNGMRVGIEATGDPGGIGHTETAANYTIEFWTENQYTYGDGQTMKFGTVFGTEANFTNNQGGEQVKRFTKTYAYKYPTNSYGSSPGSISFSCTVVGAYNGVTPYHSRSYTIPARPYALPAAPSSVVASRVSDETNKVTWNNRPTAGEPYTGVDVWRAIYGYGSYAGSGGWVKLVNGGATAESYSDTGMVPNRKSYYYVEAQNSIGYSSNTVSNVIWTMPATPTSVVRSGTTGNQTITWTNNVCYSEYVTEVWCAVNGVWGSSALATVGPGGPGTQGTYVHSASSPGGAPDPTKKYKYKVRTNPTASGVPTSSFSGDTTESQGMTFPPFAPTNISPPSGTVASPADTMVVSWKHQHAGDGAAQSAWEVQYRVNGGSYTSTGKITGTASSYTIPGTKLNDQVWEWQVRTWGYPTTAGTYSALSSIIMEPAVPTKYPLVLDLSTGRVEASSTTVIGGGGSSLVVQDENVTKVSGATILDFQGAGVTTTLGDVGEAIVNIPGATSNVVICTSTTRPASPVEGALIYESDTGRSNVFAGGQWNPVTDTSVTIMPVKCTTFTGNFTLSGTATTMDNVTLAVGDRVLVTQQTAPAENGVYVVQSGAWTRAPDANTAAAVTRPAQVFVQAGTFGFNKVFQQNKIVAAIGSDAQEWRVPNFVDVIGAFSYPQPGLGTMAFNTNSDSLAVWNGYGWQHVQGTFVVAAASKPTFATTGNIAYETDTGLAKIWDGSTWQTIGGGGSAGATSEVFNQGTPATTWTVNHALAFRPAVSVVDSAGTLVEGDVQYTSATQIVLTFSAAFSGTAYLS